jgi:hypothetical protein
LGRKIKNILKNSKLFTFISDIKSSKLKNYLTNMCWSCLGSMVLVACLRNGRLFFFNPGLHNADPNPTRSFPQLLGEGPGNSLL